MPRYIDAYKLYSRLIDSKHLFCKNQLEFRALPPNDKARVDEIDNIISIVINFPTADVVERKKGKWRYYDGMCSCSVCNSHMDDISPFCPMCGADMRG